MKTMIFKMRMVKSLGCFVAALLITLPGTLARAQAELEPFKTKIDQIEISQLKYGLIDQNLVIKYEAKLQSGENVGPALVELYLGSGRVQEAIWTLRRINLFTEADRLNNKLDHFLATEKIVHWEPHPLWHKKLDFEYRGQRTTEHRGQVAFFANGMSALQKYNPPVRHHSIRIESIAYKIDRLFNLNIVPSTQLRNLEHFYPATVSSTQLFLGDVVPGHRSLRPEAFISRRERFKDASRSIMKMYFLDLLLSNVDRHGTNWLVRLGGEPVAIDQSTIYVESEVPDISLLLKAGLGEQISKMNIEDFLRNFPEAEPQEIYALRKNFTHLQNALLNHQEVVEPVKNHRFPALHQALLVCRDVLSQLLNPDGEHEQNSFNNPFP